MTNTCNNFKRVKPLRNIITITKGQGPTEYTSSHINRFALLLRNGGNEENLKASSRININRKIVTCLYDCLIS